MKKKLSVIIVVILSVLLVSSFLIKSSFHKDLSSNDYNKYDGYWLKLEVDESFNHLSNILKMDGFEELVKLEGATAYKNIDENNTLQIEKLLEDGSKVTEILVTKDDDGKVVMYSIDYFDSSNKRWILDYHQDFARLTFKKLGKVIQVKNDMTMDTYYVDWRNIFHKIF